MLMKHIKLASHVIPEYNVHLSLYKNKNPGRFLSSQSVRVVCGSLNDGFTHFTSLPLLEAGNHVVPQLRDKDVVLWCEGTHTSARGCFSWHGDSGSQGEAIKPEHALHDPSLVQRLTRPPESSGPHPSLTRWRQTSTL